MNDYLEYVFKNNNCMPNPRGDVKRMAGLHSWYKKLNNKTVAYPLLTRGEEPKYQICSSYTDDNQNNFHWRLVFDLSIHQNMYGIQIEDNIYNPIPSDIITFMKKFPIPLNSSFSPSNTEQINECERQCKAFWNELHNMYFNNKIKNTVFEFYLPNEVLINIKKFI
jgi:hypothetical protein